MRFVLVTILCIYVSSCVPDFLAKYRGKSKSTSPTPEHSDTLEVSSRAEPRSIKQASIYALNNQKYRFLIKDKYVWSSLIDVLLKNYNLNIVNHGAGIITTEWDRFFINDIVYRNKISIRVKRVSYTTVDVTIYNNVEKLHDSGAVGGPIWLPTKGEVNEVSRIVQNVALLLNQPAPRLANDTKFAKNMEKKSSK